MGIAVVYACVNVISKSFATLPVRLFQREGDKRRVADDHWAHELIAESPNGEMTTVDFRRVLQSHLSLYNNAYFQIRRNGMGEVAEAWPLHPANVELQRDENDQLQYHFTGQLDGKKPLSADKVVHLRGLTFDGVMGFDPISGLRDVFGLAMALDTNLAKFFANDSRPGTILEVPEGLSDQAYNRLKEAMEGRKGVDERYRYMILEEGAKIAMSRMANRESQTDESRARQALEICRIYNVPPHKVQILDNATFSNIEEQQIDWVSDCIMPLAVTWEAALNRWLLTRTDRRNGLYFKIDLRGLMRGKDSERAEYYSKMVSLGIMSRNEVRALEDLDPAEGLDEFLRPLNMDSANDSNEE